MEVAVKPTRPPPPIATKPKPPKADKPNSAAVRRTNSTADASRTPTANGNATGPPPPPTKPPAPAVKPKPKQSPPQVHKKPFCNKADPVDSRSTAREQTTLGPSNNTECSSPKVSPLASKKPQHPPALKKTEIASQQLSQKNKRDSGNDTTVKVSPVPSPKLLSRKTTANQKPSPVLPKKLPPPRPPGGGVPANHHRQPVIPIPQVINQQQDNKPITDDDIYETPDQSSVRIPNGSTTNNSNGTAVNNLMNRTSGSTVSVCSEYETPASVRDSMVGGDSNGGDIYARLSDTFETPPDSNSTTNVGGGEGEGDKGGDVYEVPVSVDGNDSVVIDDAYETPNIESIRMIQRQLMEQSSNSSSSLTGERGGGIPPPPAMTAPKPHLHTHQGRSSPLAKRKLPSFPPSNDQGHAPSTERPGDGYTKVKGGIQFIGQVITQDGLIYEEVKPKQKQPVVVEQEEYVDPALVMPTDPLAPPLPPRKQFQSSNKSDIRPAPLKPVAKTPSPLDTKGEGLELMEEDEEGEDYVDMSAVATPITPPTKDNEVMKHRAVSDTRLQHQSLSYSVSMEESDGIYEQMDISRPVPPPRKKRNNKTTRNPPPQKPNLLKSSLSFDSGVGGNYVTMHRQN